VAHLSTIPTRQSVSAAWDRYQALVLAVAADPMLAADPAQQEALERAHARWSKAFVEWNGQ
jgi:hypothetical protein